MRRVMACGACVGLLLAGIVSANAEDQDDQKGSSLIGKKVIAIRSDVVLRLESGDGAKFVDFTPACNPLEIGVEQGPWLGSSHYWVRRAEIVPLSEAIAYFGRHIEQSPTAYAYVARSRAWRIEKHDLDKALADAEEAIQLDPNCALT